MFVHNFELSTRKQIFITYIHRSVVLPLLQSPLVYPGLHPLSHCPVCLLHEVLFRQCPLQLLTQLYPKVPKSHSKSYCEEKWELMQTSRCERINIGYLFKNALKNKRSTGLAVTWVPCPLVEPVRKSHFRIVRFILESKLIWQLPELLYITLAAGDNYCTHLVKRDLQSFKD